MSNLELVFLACKTITVRREGCKIRNHYVNILELINERQPPLLLFSFLVGTAYDEVGGVQATQVSKKSRDGRGKGQHSYAWEGITFKDTREKGTDSPSASYVWFM